MRCPRNANTSMHMMSRPRQSTMMIAHTNCVSILLVTTSEVPPIPGTDRGTINAYTLTLSDMLSIFGCRCGKRRMNQLVELGVYTYVYIVCLSTVDLLVENGRRRDIIYSNVQCPMSKEI
jgi:hypothetical protein